MKRRLDRFWALRASMRTRRRRSTSYDRQQVAGQTWRQRCHRSYSFVDRKIMPRCCFRSTVSGMFHARFSTVMARTFAALISWTLVLLSGLPIAALAQNAPATVTIDASLNRRPINPNIYGVAHATAAQLNDLNSPLNRNGGNNTTRYNWQLNADNRGNDWYFESIADASATAGERGDTFIANARAANAQADAHDPDDRLGRQARRRTARKLASFSIAKYGAQTGNDWQWFPDAGNGVRTQRPERHRQRSQRRQRAVQLGASSRAGCSTWSAAGARTRTAACATTSSTTSRASGTRRTATSIRPARRWTRSATKIDRLRRQDQGRRPGALVVGPEEWGWSGYFYSGYDQQYGSAARLELAARPRQPRRRGLPAVAARSAAPATTSPPASGCSTSSPSTTTRRAASSATTSSSAMQLRRNRSTRSLWDPNYVDETWINDRVQLIPRLRGWVNTYYSGHADRHHRIQLGRRGPHQRRHHAGRHLRHLRPRRARHGARAGRRPAAARRPTRR